VNLSICSHASNTKEYEKDFKTNPLSPKFLNKDFCEIEIVFSLLNFVHGYMLNPFGSFAKPKFKSSNHKQIEKDQENKLQHQKPK
jgi:hypothetical protein